MTSHMSIDLRKRFRELWGRSLMGGATNQGDSRFDTLLRHYGARERRYHGWGHLTHCLSEFDGCSGLMDCPDAVEMALWLHDAIYVPGAATNEQDSAALFQTMAHNQHDPDHIRTVCHYILLTRHRDEPNDADGCYVVDIDLSQLASEWGEYVQDSENIRREAAHIPDDTFFPAQLGFLRALLGRERIFRTEWFHARYEHAARENVSNFIARLQAAGYE
ncbi:HD domain-containing protein [Methylolobus aquaticus]